MSSGSERIMWKSGNRWLITASTVTSATRQTLDPGGDGRGVGRSPTTACCKSFQPAMMTRVAAQLLVVSTAGTEARRFCGIGWMTGRTQVEPDSRSRVCYFEWSGDADADPDNTESWPSCMPAFGLTVSEETIRADRDSMDAAGVARGI
jgi:hypothetical protein